MFKINKILKKHNELSELIPKIALITSPLIANNPTKVPINENNTLFFLKILYTYELGGFGFMYLFGSFSDYK